MANDANEPAFPNPTFNGQSQGLSKREYFACAAMQGILTGVLNCFTDEGLPKDHTVAKDSVVFADALIAELGKEKS